MNISEIKTSQHIWEKQNLVTINRNGKMFDEVICKSCGMKGKRFTLSTVEVSEKYKIESVNLCPKAELRIPKKVKITFCNALGEEFRNLEPGSIHEVVTPPEGYKNDNTGVWVMGVGEPVKLLANEYVFQL